MAKKKPFFISIPHSGERVPEETPWLRNLPEPILMCDVDRFVDRLYAPVITELGMPAVMTEWHRYVVDLNRLPDDVGPDTVEGSQGTPGQFASGLHWRLTTRGDILLPKPITRELHELLVQKYFMPFHHEVRARYEEFRRQGNEVIYHLDAHSMPSMGTKAHRDPGERRADIVVSDCEGKSCSGQFKDLVIQAYRDAGLKVAYNWPYIGGRVTQTYGHPERGQHAIQVEISRALYMDEENKTWLTGRAEELSAKLSRAVEHIFRELPL